VIILESCPADFRGIIGSCRFGRVITFYGLSFANLPPSIYHANAAWGRFPAVPMGGYSTRLRGYSAQSCPLSDEGAEGLRLTVATTNFVNQLQTRLFVVRDEYAR
jgi:hypothetical protein